jgi:DNA mismatch repair ATPase MutS
MSVILLFVVVFMVCVCSLHFYKRHQRRNETRRLEESWGKKLDRYRNFYHIKKYAAFEKAPDSYSLTPQTLEDIDIESLFSFVDRTSSTVGQQYLFSRIINPGISITELESRGRCSDFFVQDESLRKKAKLLLHDFEKTESHLIADLFNPGLTASKSKHETIVKFLCGLAIASTLLCWIYPAIGILMLFLFGINLMIHLIFRNNKSHTLKAIRQVYRLIQTSEALIELKMPVRSDDIYLARKKLRRFRKTYHFLDFGIPLNDVSSIVFYLLDLLKAFFLTEVQLLNFSHNELINNKSAVQLYYKYLGECELALSTASLKCDETIVTCTPTFHIESGSLQCLGLVHPLVKGCVPNSVVLNESNAFITGSNMSGKSTFLRTVILNSVLGQSLNLCFAESFASLILHAFSSVKIADNLQEGVSYYFEEVNIMHEMVIASGSGSGNLFIIDEIFKGTNTVERIALSKALLQYLSTPGNFVIASSHDIELVELLGNSFELYHFAESIQNDDLHFDHKIKPGPLKTKNAIRILEISGFPNEIIANARSFTKKLETS